MKPHHTLKPSILIVALLVLLACQIPTAVGLPFLAATPTSTLTLTQTPTLTATATFTPTPTGTPTASQTPTLTATIAPQTRRVVIVSIDGLRPDAILPAPMPNLISLMQSGAFSLGAQTVYPSVTLVAHASMLSGLCPSKHGVYWNEYQPELGFAEGTNLFDLAHAAGYKPSCTWASKN